ncbi:hypothetical protein SLEP1_g26403 [Rubroshorea leprosula]|uniref:Uncharacterized protein n=1 Tax=Rubroshorea leprosula TaxID=152421 RepID=A0AAV5JT02_9ROSI|nr:hypothetical protein SLEP1_g26403 [Rubroshorea leprosula]
MWLIFLYWLIKSSDHSIEIVMFCEDWQVVIKLYSLLLPISTFLISGNCLKLLKSVLNLS